MKLTASILIEKRIGGIDRALRLRGVRRLHTRAVRVVNGISASQATSLSRDKDSLYRWKNLVKQLKDERTVYVQPRLVNVMSL